MKEQALEIASSGDNRLSARNLLREYLQHVILRELFDAGLLDSFVFHGGTALRLLHDLPRFSEDLDFHLDRQNPDYNLKNTLQKLQNSLEASGYKIHRSDSLEGTVKSSFIKFRGLLYEAELSPHQDENLSIKIELDTNPPEGFSLDSSFVSEFFPISLLHHDRSSFLAGKLHAILQRNYTKGRDFFDLMFYISRWEKLHPNIEYLNNALSQTGYTGPEISETNWKAEVRNVVREIDWGKVKQDVGSFLERQSDLKAFQKDYLVSLLEDR